MVAAPIGRRAKIEGMAMEYYGIHTALAMPFTKTGRAIDHRKLKALVDDQIAHGIHGLVVCGSS
ncbi:MAG: dihydrodipicolinate synthase family protein [Proteobacteria bacterium]|nr:dihydrodipicolinate synthase family protein [Pseudomonadota bacterium]